MMLYFLLEEESAKVFLENMLPRVFPELNFKCIAFEGKQDLMKNIPRKLKGIRTPNSKFIILRDQDSALCNIIKEEISHLCVESKKTDTVIRIACRELEAWYLGDLNTVGKVFGIERISGLAKRRNYREPDKIVNPKAKLKIITKGKYTEISGSRELGKSIDCNNNRSHSFNIFVNGIKKLIEKMN